MQLPSLFGPTQAEIAMRKLNWIILIPTVALGAACGRNSSPAVDDALKSDLALASQAQSLNAAQISPTEAGLAGQPQQFKSNSTTAIPRVTTPARRASTVRRSSGSSSRSSGGYYPAQAPAAPAKVVVKHTQRDAAIGAVAGAVIGATTSRNKVKGGVIGAAVGGILGGVIGNNVDKQTKIPW
jgi:hypothetical protein